MRLPGRPKGSCSRPAGGAARAARIRCGIAALGLLAAAIAQAQPAAPPGPAALRDASLAAGCAACHGSDGRPVAGAAVPGLAAMPAPYLRDQMLAFRSGARPGTVMPQLAKGYTEEQIDRLAEYFSRQSPAGGAR